MVSKHKFDLFLFPQKHKTNCDILLCATLTHSSCCKSLYHSPHQETSFGWRQITSSMTCKFINQSKGKRLFIKLCHWFLKVPFFRHLQNHRNERCKVLYNPDKMKAVIPHGNTMTAEETFAWMSRYKKTGCQNCETTGPRKGFQ